MSYATTTMESTSGLWCRKTLARPLDADELFQITKQGFDWYHANFGVRYAFGKYDQLFVPEFNAGAMENAGCVTFHEDYLFRSKVTDARYERRAATILDEMAHMWFGDLVTMRWWDDLWLNESFADYACTLCQTQATRWTSAWTTFANVEETWAYRQDQLPSTHPIATDAPDVQTTELNFDGITYAKGASVLKQLGAYVGVDAFLAGLRDYFQQHAFGTRRWLTCCPLWSVLRPRSRRVEQALARDGRHQHDPSRVRGRRRGPLHVLRPRTDRTRRRGAIERAASAQARHRPLRRAR